MGQDSQNLISIIRFLRKRHEVKANWARFEQIIQNNHCEIFSELNLRWLVSIADTIADHSGQPRASQALSISMFVNTLRIAEMVKLSRISSIEDISSIEFKELYSGITSFSVERQDTFLNISRRMKFLLSGDQLLCNLWEEVLNRVHSSDSVLKEFQAKSNFPERYFPVNPLGIYDNYGNMYEDLY